MKPGFTIKKDNMLHYAATKPGAKLIIACCLLILACWSRPGWGFELDGLSTPESFIYDAASKNYFISNINGTPTDVDHNGFISRLDDTGKLKELRFIDGSRKETDLNAPKGLTVVKNVLYVTDIDTVKGFDTGTGKKVAEFSLKEQGAIFLNDITSQNNGSLYLTDTGTNSIFRIDLTTRKASLLLKNGTLNGPNGLAFAPDGTLFVGSWRSGNMFKIVDNEVEKLPIASFENLDGIDFDKNGNLYIADFTGGRIYKIKQNLTVELIKENLTTPADINIDKIHNLLLLPSFQGNSVKTISLNHISEK